MHDQGTLAELVERYFAAVDAENMDELLGTLTPDCIFRVETHGIEMVGHEQIAGMFRRLWADHAAVRHEEFRHVADPAQGRIASQFTVINTLADGTLVHKSNCNFFTVRDGRFCAISVYMTGDNTLK